MNLEPNDESCRRPRTGLRARFNPLVTLAESANSTRPRRLCCDQHRGYLRCRGLPGLYSNGMQRR